MADERNPLWKPPSVLPFNLPVVWDETAIIRELDNLRLQPSVLGQFLTELTQRFILRQHDQTARSRIQFLRSRVELYKAGKELETALDDLRFHDLERDIRRRKLELERQDLENRQKKQQELDELTHEREKLKLKLEVAKMQKEMEDLEKPAEPPKRKLTTEEKRARGKAYWLKYLERLDREEAEDIQKITRGMTFDELSGEEQEKVMAIRNMYGDAKDRATEQLRKYL